jgi:biliverdin reductase
MEKGKFFAHGERTFELYGDKGKLIFQGEKGLLIQAQKTTEIKVSPRQGFISERYHFSFRLFDGG